MQESSGAMYLINSVFGVVLSYVLLLEEELAHWLLWVFFRNCNICQFYDAVSLLWYIVELIDLEVFSGW